jgi:hypothetical protein
LHPPSVLDVSVGAGYGSTFCLHRYYELRVHHSQAASSVVLEYSSHGKVVATGYPYSNRYISVAVIKDRKVSQWRGYLDPLRVFAALEERPSSRMRPKRVDGAPSLPNCLAPRQHALGWD